LTGKSWPSPDLLYLPCLGATGLHAALALAGTDLTVFLAACLMLISRFLPKTVLLEHQCFGFYWAVLAQNEDYQFLSLCTPVSRLGLSKKLGEDTDGIALPDLPKVYSIPYNIIPGP